MAIQYFWSQGSKYSKVNRQRIWKLILLWYALRCFFTLPDKELSSCFPPLWTLWNTMNVIKLDFLYKGCIPFAVGVAWMYDLFGKNTFGIKKWFKQQYIEKYIIRCDLQKSVEMRTKKMCYWTTQFGNLPCLSAEFPWKMLYLVFQTPPCYSFLNLPLWHLAA